MLFSIVYGWISFQNPEMRRAIVRRRTALDVFWIRERNLSINIRKMCILNGSELLSFIPVCQLWALIYSYLHGSILCRCNIFLLLHGSQLRRFLSASGISVTYHRLRVAGSLPDSLRSMLFWRWMRRLWPNWLYNWENFKLLSGVEEDDVVESLAQ